LAYLSLFFRMIGNRTEDIYSPFMIPHNYYSFIQTYENFYMGVLKLKVIGLNLVDSDGEYWIHFINKYPMYVYIQISEACIYPNQIF